jgi:hypothetical protein
MRRMMHIEPPQTRTLTIVLPESDWHALRAAEPDAVGWLQARIRERLGSPVSTGSRPVAASSMDSTHDWSEHDDY